MARIGSPATVAAREAPQGHLVALGVVLVEPRQGPLEVEQRLLRATDGHGRLGRRSARADRRRQVAHRRGVAGELGRGGELGTLGQRGGIRPVEAQALAREQAVGDRLAEQGVAEGVGRGPPRLEDVVLDGRGQRRLEASRRGGRRRGRGGRGR